MAFFDCVDLRASFPFLVRRGGSRCWISAHEQAVRQNPDKQQLREAILEMLASGMSYHETGVALGIHWTRVG